MRSLLLLLLGIPIPIIILIALFVHGLRTSIFNPSKESP